MYYWLTVFSPPRLIFPLGASRPIGNTCTHRMRVENDFRGPSVQALPHPSRVSLACARSLFRLLRRLVIGIESVTGRCSSPLACLPRTPRSSCPLLYTLTLVIVATSSRTNARGCKVFFPRLFCQSYYWLSVWVTGFWLQYDWQERDFAEGKRTSTLRVIVILVLFSCRNS